MAKSPLVSVLVPSYNGEAYLNEALSSIQRQTYRNLEVLIRDDGSTDGTLAIIAKYVYSDPRFTYITADSEPGSTRNMVGLLKRAKGDFIKVCNQDDLLEPSCIDLLARPMLADSSIVLSTSRRHLIDATGKILPAAQYNAPLSLQDTKFPGTDLARQALTRLTNQIGEPSTVLFRNRMFTPAETFTLDGYTYIVNNDIALWLKLLMHGDAFYSAQPLSKFRIHDKQRSAEIVEKITGVLEWLSLLDWAIKIGLIRTGTETQHALHGIVDAFAWLSQTASHADPEHHATHAARIAAGVAQLRRVIAEATTSETDLAA